MTTLAPQSPQVLEGPLNKFEFFEGNVNVMAPAEYQQLVADMRAHGPSGIDPISAVYKKTLEPSCSDPTWMVVVNGNHRLKAAMELGWKAIRYMVEPSVKTWEDVAVYSFRRSSERGKVDDFKLAAAFKKLVDEQSWSQKRVAEFYGLDATTVSKKLGLLGISPEVRAKLQGNTRISVSHIEPLVGLPADVQKTAANDIVKGDYSVREVEDLAKQAKATLKKKELLAEAIAASEFKVCPKCGKPPRGFHYNEAKYVECSGNQYWTDEHIWNLVTGMTKVQERDQERAKERKELGIPETRKKEPDQFVRTTYTIADFEVAFAAFVRELIPQFESIGDINVGGKVGGKYVHLSIDGYGSVHHFSFLKRGVDDRNDDLASLSFGLEHKSYSIQSLKDYKTVITGGLLRGPADQKALEKKAMDFLAKYGNGKVAPAAAEAPVVKKRGRPKGSKNKASGK